MSVLEVEGLRTVVRARDVTASAVDGVDLHIDRGETLGLVGESGSGKTLTGLSLLRLLPPGCTTVAGAVRLDGTDVLGLDERSMRTVRGRRIAMVFQDATATLNPTMTIGRQIAECLVVHKLADAETAWRRAVELLEETGVPIPEQRARQYPHELSGGQRQRAVIAMALSCRPDVLIADEPTTALDVSLQAQILSLFGDRALTSDMATMLITHDLGVVAGRADRVAIMYAGRIVETAPTADLFRRPRHRYTEALLVAARSMYGSTNDVLPVVPGSPPDLAEVHAGCAFAPRCAHATEQCRDEHPPFERHGAHGFACFHPRAVDDPVVIRTIAPATAGRAPAAVGRGTPNGDVLVEVRDVTKSFALRRGVPLSRRRPAIHAVDGVSLTVRRGESFGLVGESGCGKTTLGRLIVGLDAPDRGEIVVEGRPSARGIRRAGRGLQFMFQDPFGSLDPRWRVRKIVEEPLAIQGDHGRSAREARVEQLLGEVGLAERHLRSFPHELSGGQRQRVALARVLAPRPKLVVADEPVSALDVSIRSQVLNLLRDVQRTHALSLIVVSHDLSVVRHLATRVGVMYLGKLVETGPTAAVLDAPAHHYTAGLLASIPSLDPEQRSDGAALRGELPSPIDPPSGCRFRTRCPAAQAKCASDEPPLARIADDHLVACHFPLGTTAVVPER